MATSLREQFTTQGYAVVGDVLSTAQIRALRDDYAQVLDTLATRLYKTGKIRSSFSTLPFEERYSAIWAEVDEDIYPHFDISLPNTPITQQTPFNLSRAVFGLLHAPRILDAVEQLIGGELFANPIQHVRIKPPRTQVNALGSTLTKKTGWHQDQGVSRQEADDTEMITVWVAITDATPENGCLQLIPGSHTAGISTHCPSDEMTIPDKLLNGDPLPVPVRAGSALLLHRRTQHASLDNCSGSIRWSFDLRYQPIGQPTGRDEFPGLIVRSRQNPGSIQRDYDAWVQAWHDARAHIAAAQSRQKLHRWDGDAPVCL